MTIFRGTVLDTPDDPFTGGALRADDDAGLLVRDGVILERGAVRRGAARRTRTRTSSTSPAAWSCPGSSTPTSTPPRSAPSAGSGMPLLDWLERCALPEEARLADAGVRGVGGRRFVSGLVQAGRRRLWSSAPTSRPPSTSCSSAADRVGLRITSGLVVSDRLLRERPVHHAAARLRRGAGGWPGAGTR